MGDDERTAILVELGTIGERMSAHEKMLTEVRTDVKAMAGLCPAHTARLNNIEDKLFNKSRRNGNAQETTGAPEVDIGDKKFKGWGAVMVAGFAVAIWGMVELAKVLVAK